MSGRIISSGSGSGGWLSALVERTRDRFVASDPAFSRLRLASRAMLTLLLTSAALALVQLTLHPLPTAAFGLGIVISLIGSLAIRDASPRAQLVSRIFAAGGSCVSVAAAALLAPYPAYAYAAFLLLIFAAVYVRRFGARWFGIGLLSFMAFFMGDFLHPPADQLGWVAVAAAIAFGAAHLVTTILLPDNAERDFRRALTTIDRRIDLIWRHLQGETAAGRQTVVERKPLRVQLARLREAVLMAEGFIPQGERGALAAHGAASELAVALFELQLFVERVVGAAFAALPDAKVFAAARAGREAALARWQRERSESEPAAAATARLIIRVLRARQRLSEVLGETPGAAFAETAPTDAALAAATSSAPEPTRGIVPPAFHAPIQVTVACALALGVGLLLSADRWYWAVITAFIVFNNAQSRTDTAMRALQRSAGTLGGLIVGSLAATALAGHTIPSVVAILVLFYVGFYFVQASYSTMIFCITVALALIYGVLGMFTPQLLLLRLEETVVGALAGTGVAFLLFANRGSDLVAGKLSAYLDALSDLLAGARAQLGAGASDVARGETLLARSRAVDRAYADLAVAVRPLGGPWRTVTRYGAVREKLLLLTGCAHWGRSLARGLADSGPIEGAMRRRMGTVIAEIEGRIAAARAQGVTLFAGSARDHADLSSSREALPFDKADTPAFALEIISALLRRATAQPTREERPSKGGKTETGAYIG